MPGPRNHERRVASDFDGICTLPGKENPACLIAAPGISDLPDRRAASPGTTWSRHYYCVQRAFAVRHEDRDALHDVPDFIGRTVIVTEGSTAPMS